MGKKEERMGKKGRLSLDWHGVGDEIQRFDDT
jgi:hypothetical protein